MPSNSPNQGWRQGQSGPAKFGARGWRRPGTKPGRRPWSPKAKRVTAICCLGGLVGVLAWVILLLRPGKQAMLVVAGAPFDTNLSIPADVYGWKTLQDLAAASKDTGESSAWERWWGVGPVEKPDEEQPAKLTRAWIQQDSWWKEAKKAKTVVLYLAAHGGVDDQGAFLFVSGDPDDRGDDRIDRVHISELFGRFSQDGPKKKNFFLILDATQVPSCPSEGQLYNDFVETLQQEVEKRDLSNLMVLCSSKPNERSWIWDQRQQSAFGYYVAQALEGNEQAATHGQITVDSMYRYVRDQVKEWASTRRDQKQEPILIYGPTAKNLHSQELRQVNRGYQEQLAEHAQPVPMDGLAAIWQERDTLARQLPEVYTPHDWRRYQDSLERYEELVRAGDPTGKANVLQERIGSLHRSIERAKDLQRLSCVSNSLNMPLALGMITPWPDPATARSLDDALRRWWNAEGRAWRATQAKAKAVPDPKALQSAQADLKAWKEKLNDRQLLPVASAAFVVGKLIDNLTHLNDSADGKAAYSAVHEAAHMLRGLESQGWGNENSRPIEAQFVVMLDKYLDPKSPPDRQLLLQALRVQRKAERVALSVDDQHPGHPYSEQVYTWIHLTVEAGDRERRAGEDLVFGATPAVKAEAKAHLQKAAAIYDRAAKAAAIVRHGLAVRDRTEARLPYYTDWLTRLSQDPKDAPDAMRTAIRTWQDLHALNKLLAEPAAASIEGETGVRLAELAHRIQKNFDDIQKAFNNSVELRFRSDPGLPEVKRDLDILLTLPIIPADRRMALLQAARTVEHKVAENANKNTIPGADAQSELAWAVRRGSLDAALLGLGTDVSFRADRSALRDAGERIRTKWRERADTIRQNFQLATQQTTVQQSLKPLRQADQLCRLVDGATIVDDAPMTPEQAFVRAELNELLLWQARRTIDDHWWSEQQAGVEPYFVAAAHKYARDAKDLASVDPNSPARVRTWRTKPADDLASTLTDARIKVARVDATRVGDAKAPALPPEVTITSEGQFKLAYRLQAASIPKGGAPMVWLQDPGKESGVRLAREASLVRQPVTQTALEPYELVSTVKSGDDLAISDVDYAPRSTIVFNTFFRGQLIPTPTTLIFYSHPDMIAYDAPPRDKKAQVAVWADEDVAEGTIEIVLDASGSMGVGPGVPYDDKTPCKYHKATQALARVLEEVPPHINVGIWIFGQDGATNGEPMEFREPQPLLRRELKDLIKDLSRQRPMYGSPIVNTMVRASRRLHNKPGLKTLFVLTDGKDEHLNPATKDYETTPVEKVQQTILDNFGENSDGGDIRVSMLLFDSKAERATAEKQFKGAVTSLSRGRGMWFDTDTKFGKGKEVDVESIRQCVRQAMLPRLRLLRAPTVRSQPVHFLPLTALDWTNPALEPGPYDAILFKDARATLTLRPAERMIIHLRHSIKDDRTSPVVFTREIIGNLRENVNKPRDPALTMPAGDWLTTVLTSRFQHSETSGFLDMLVAVENLHNGPVAETLRQVQPGLLWMEVKPVDAEAGEPPLICWGKRTNYETPSWDIFAPTWPADTKNAPDRAKAQLEVWWSDPAGDIEPIPAHYHPDAGKHLNKLAHSYANGITIESVTLEPQTVIVGKEEGNKPRTDTKDCLVVRLRYTGDDPVLVRMNGVEGSEHKFYRKAHKVTAIFWGGDVGPSLPDRSFDLDLVSVAQLKRKGNGIHYAKPGAPEGGVPVQDRIR